MTISASLKRDSITGAFEIECESGDENDPMETFHDVIFEPEYLSPYRQRGDSVDWIIDQATDDDGKAVTRDMLADRIGMRRVQAIEADYAEGKGTDW